MDFDFAGYTVGVCYWVGYCGLVRFASLVLFLVLFSLGSVIAVRVCLEFVDNSVIVALLIIRCCFVVAFKLAWGLGVCWFCGSFEMLA